MIHNFPDEIAHDILFRLPHKSLIRCTAVCKPWKSMIKNPIFIRTHLARTIKSTDQLGTHLLLLHCVPRAVLDNEVYNLRVDEPTEEHYYLHFDNNDFDEYCKIQCPIVPKKKLYNEFLRVVGCCNGLVFLADDKSRLGYTFIICNPSIRKSVTLPLPHLTFKTIGPYSACTGFGFDATTNDYKVVRLLTDQDDNPTMCEVYSLATGSWSNPREVVPDCEILDRSSPPAFVNGAIHWEAWRRVRSDGCPKFILAFDVASELFREIMLPKSLMCDEPLGWELSVTGDRKSIALFMMRRSFFGDHAESLGVWVMKEYCNEESWTKVITLRSEGPLLKSVPSSKALCFRKSGEVVVMQTEYYHGRHELVSLDLVSKQFKNLGIWEYRDYSAYAYEESLVLLDKTDAVSY